MYFSQRQGDEMDWFSELGMLLAAAKNAAPAFKDLVDSAETLGADVAQHKGVAQMLSDAVAGFEKAIADATGINAGPPTPPKA